MEQTRQSHFSKNKRLFPRKSEPLLHNPAIILEMRDFCDTKLYGKKIRQLNFNYDG